MNTILRTIAALGLLIACLALALPPHGGLMDLIGIGVVALNIFANYVVWT